jgi:hypothetical protein
MMNDSPQNPPDAKAADDAGETARRRFEQSAQNPAPGLAAEFIAFLRQNKKWWLLPILVVLLLMGLLIFLTGTAAAPFIYPFF